MADEKLQDVAPTLAAAGLSDERLQADLGEKPSPAAPEVPAHHKVCCYEHLLRGDSIEQAAQAASVPVAVAQTIATEMDAVCGKLARPSPVKRPDKPEHGDGGGKPEDVIK